MNKDFLEHMWRLWPISIIHFPISYVYIYIYIYILIWDPLAFSLFKVLKCEHGFNGFFLSFLAFLSNGCFDFSQLGEHCPLSNPILLTKFQLWNQPFDLTFEAIIAVDHISHLILSKSYVCCVFFVKVLNVVLARCRKLAVDSWHSQAVPKFCKIYVILQTFSMTIKKKKNLPNQPRGRD